MKPTPIISSTLDLSQGDNVVQARHELHRAIDRGGETETAAWALKWGEAALAAGERVSRDAMDCDGMGPPSAAVRANELAISLRTELQKEAPDLDRCGRLAGELAGKTSTILEAYEL
jgi:hypothetical protein